ncbi:hypothetical protein BE20_01795 [Sorangium cellulosum]|nr:hypothetical protein BE20_01795 [Sorangium cellulosum]
MTGGDGGSGGVFTGTCTESRPTDRRVSGSGPHQVVVETNPDPGINEGTIFRPADLGGGADLRLGAGRMFARRALD